MVLRDPKTKNLKDLGQANVGVVPRKIGVCGQILIETLSLSWCGELSQEVCPSIFSTPCQPSTRYLCDSSDTD